MASHQPLLGTRKIYAQYFQSLKFIKTKEKLVENKNYAKFFYNFSANFGSQSKHFYLNLVLAISSQKNFYFC